MVEKRGMTYSSSLSASLSSGSSTSSSSSFFLLRVLRVDIVMYVWDWVCGIGCVGGSEFYV